MVERFFPVVLSVWLVWAVAVGSEAEKKTEETKERSTLELRVLQLEDEIAELRETLAQLRDHLLQKTAEDSQAELAAGESSGRVKSSVVPPVVAEISSPAAQDPAQDPNTMRLYWSEGIRMDSADRKVRLRAGGRIQNDWAFHYGDEKIPVNAQDGSEFRRSRIYFSGEAGRIEFKAEYDFAGGDADFTDVYLGVGDLPVLGTLKMGHFKEPFGLELLTSSRFTTFMERSIGTLAFAPSRNTGFMFSNNVLDNRLTWAAGFFKTTTNSAGSALGDGSYAFTGRIAGTPWRNSDTRLLHLGAAYSHRDASNEQVRFAPRPEGHLVSALVNTGTLATDSNDRIGLEAAWVYDRFSLQTEFMNVFLDSPQNDDPSLNSFYFEGSFFLTPDSRNYRAGSAAFDRVRPGKPLFAGEGGSGAWELAARYSRIDLDDGFVLGGTEKNFTLGLNWYLNASSKIMFNFVHADPAFSESLKILQTRFQIDF